jgi:hypothetical protein
MVPNGLNYDSITLENTINEFFTCEMETGDIALPANVADMQIAPMRLHIDYTNHGPFRVLVKSSIDGGANYSSTSTYFLGALPIDEARYHAVLDVGPQNAHFARYNITIVPEDTSGLDADPSPVKWQIDKMYFQYEVTQIDGA